MLRKNYLKGLDNHYVAPAHSILSNQDGISTENIEPHHTSADMHVHLINESDPFVEKLAQVPFQWHPAPPPDPSKLGKQLNSFSK